MGGMALGSWFLGPLADRRFSGLKLFGVFELGIGAYAILFFPFLESKLPQIYLNLAQGGLFSSGSLVLLGSKVMISGALLIPPTVLMGGSFPVLLRYLTQVDQKISSRPSLLYAVGSLGAALGALAMAFFILPGLGLDGSSMGLGMISSSIGFLAWFLAGLKKASGAYSPPQKPVLEGEKRTAGKNWLLGLIFIEGILGFNLEISWTRYFGLVFGSSTYSFAVMLSAFVTGIGLGSLLLAYLDSRIKNPLRLFGWSQVLTGVLIFLPMPLYPYLPWGFKCFLSMLAPTEPGFYIYETGKFLVSFMVMLPACLASGMSLPLIIKEYLSRTDQVGTEAGLVYAWDTLGNVVGAALGGLILVPFLRFDGSLTFSAGGAVVLGALVLWVCRPYQRQERLALSAVLIGVFAFSQTMGSWEISRFSVAPHRRYPRIPPLKEFDALAEQRKVLFFEDDPAANLMVWEEGGDRTLVVNGKADASSGRDMGTQMLLGHLPLLLKSKVRNVALIGLGSGVTPGSMLLHPINHLYVIEIAKKMAKAASFFQPWNLKPFQDSRMQWIVDDARSFFLSSDQEFDLIVSEPSNPWQAGTASVFTREFFEIVRSRLSKEGVFLQWVQAYELGHGSVSSIILSLRKVFPYLYGFQANAGDLLILAAKNALKPDLQALRTAISKPRISKQLKTIGLETAEQLLLLQKFSPASTKVLAASAPDQNTDDNLFLETQAPKDLFLKSKAKILKRLDERLEAAPSLFFYQLFARLKPLKLQAEIFKPLTRLPLYSSEIAHNFEITYFLQEARMGNDLIENSTKEPPPHLIASPPRAPASILKRVETFLKRKSFLQAGKLLEHHISSLVILARFSPPFARELANWLEKWQDKTQDSKALAIFQKAHILLHLAGDDSVAVLEVLKKGLSSDLILDEEWLLSRLCRFSSPDPCLKIESLFKRGSNSTLVDRYFEL